MPVPGRRIVERVPVAGVIQEWPVQEQRHVSARWKGPIHMRVHGVEFNIRYAGAHEHGGHGVYPVHQHPHSECHMTLTGRGTIHMPDRGLDIPCEPGRVVLFPALEPHGSSWTLQGSDAWRLLVIDFDLALDAGPILDAMNQSVDLAFAPFYEWFFVRKEPTLMLDPESFQALEPMAWRMMQLVAEPPYGIATEVTGNALQLIAGYSRFIRDQGMADGTRVEPTTLNRDASLLKARALMEQTEMLDAGCVERVARMVGMSNSYFIREFKRSFDITPKQYSLYVIMRRAGAMLRNTDMTVKETAYALGYDEPSSFTRAFTNYFSISPSEYQRRLRRS